MKPFTDDPVEAAATLDRAANKAMTSGDPDLVALGTTVRALLDGGAQDLDEALGWGPAPGRRKVSTLLALDRRDMAVREAVKTGGYTADALAIALRRYHATGWQRDRLEREVPARLANRPERHLFGILKAHDVCIGRSRIFEIVQRTPQISLDGNPRQNPNQQEDPA